jgi:Flp pilus assembly protein TadD
MNRALNDNRFADALKSAEHLARYAPLNAQPHVILGFAAYLAGQQDRALAAFQRARELTLPTQFKQIWDNVSSRTAFQKVLEDKAFMGRATGN